MIHRVWRYDDRTVEIRDGTPDDAPRFRPYFAELVGQAAPWFPIPRSVEHLDPWLRRSGFLDFERNLHWIALDGERMVGHLLLHRMDIPSIGLEGIASPYLTVLPEYRSGGLGGALMGLWNPTVTDRLRRTGVRRVVAHVFPENGPSRRLGERVGLEFEGVLRRHMRGADGKFHDMIVLGQILSDEEGCTDCGRHLEELHSPREGRVSQ